MRHWGGVYAVETSFGVIMMVAECREERRRMGNWCCLMYMSSSCNGVLLKNEMVISPVNYLSAFAGRR